MSMMLVTCLWCAPFNVSGQHTQLYYRQTLLLGFFASALIVEIMRSAWPAGW
jgi:ABC-type amino acid transport system permease subunit